MVWKALVVWYKKPSPFLRFIFIFLRLFHCPVFSKIVYNWHVHIQVSRGCVWRHRSVAVREQGRLPDNFIKMNHLVSVLGIQWCDSLKLLLLPYKAVCALKYPALWPAMWSQADVPREDISRETSTFDRNCLPIYCTGRVLWAGFLSALNPRGPTFPKETLRCCLWFGWKRLLWNSCHFADLAGYFVSILNYLN